MRKKNILLIVVSSLLLLSISLHTPIGSQLHLQIMKPVKADPKTIIVPTNYTKIQDAINSAEPGDTIYVRNGTYYEHVIVNKNVTLVGENRNTTIIDGGGVGIVVRSNVSNVEIRGFTIQNGGGELEYSGVYIGGCVNNRIRDSIIRNSACGITLLESNGCSIINNIVVNCSLACIQIRNSSNNIIHENTIANSSTGVYITSSSSRLNMLYHNNFIDNPTQASDFGSGTIWYEVPPSGGNYWSDYTGLDDGSDGRVAGDGIGDTNIPHLGLDYYPLMEPFKDVAPPVADAGPDQTIFQGMTVTFNGSGSRDDGDIESYVWTFTDVTPKTLTGVQPTYRFKNVGNFNVTLNVTDYSSKWNTDAMWVNVSADTTKPSIGGPYQEPQVPDDGEKVTIWVNATDGESGVRNVTISYRTNSGPWNNISMSRLTGDLWEGEISGFPDGTEVQYKIIVYDNAGNFFVDDNSEHYYVYTVIPEFPVAIFLMLFLILTLVTVTLRKKGLFKL